MIRPGVLLEFAQCEFEAQECILAGGSHFLAGNGPLGLDFGEGGEAQEKQQDKGQEHQGYDEGEPGVLPAAAKRLAGVWEFHGGTRLVRVIYRLLRVATKCP